jgi:uncharacterized membrane protein YfhO
MKILKRFWPHLLIIFIALVFFSPIFKGQIPFPGDLLINQNPYKTQSFLGFLPGSYPNKAQGSDVIYEIYPWKYFSIEQIKNGQIPFWNPHNFSGNLQMANFQTAIFYPMNLLYLILPFNTAWTVFILLQPILAAFFMFLFLYKGLELKKISSVFGGIMFAFSSYMVVWMEYGNIASTFLWLPLALLLIKKGIKRPGLSNFLLLIIAFALSFLAGYIQGFFYIYIICTLYFLFLLVSKNTKQKLKKTLIFLGALVVPVILSLFQLLPTLEIFKNSTRGAYSLTQISHNLAPVYYWITIIFPDFFGNPATRNYWLNGTYIERVMYPGTVALFFAIFAILKVKTAEKKFFMWLSGLSLIIATNLPLVKYFYLLPIPVISTTIPTRELSVFIFSLVILGAIGIDYWIENKEKTKYPFIFIALLICIFPVVFLIYKVGFLNIVNFKVSIRNMIPPTIFTFVIVALFYLKDKFKKISITILALILIFDLLYFFNKITPFSPKGFTYPDTPVMQYLQKEGGINRFWGYGLGYIPSNFQSVDGTFSPEGNDPLHISSYGELLASSKDGKLPKALPRPDANIAPGFGNVELKSNPYRQRILNLLGVKYVLQKDELLSGVFAPDYVTFPQENYLLVWQKNPWQIYENKTVIPRFFLTGDFILAKNRAQSLSLIYEPSIDLNKTVILENSPGMPMDASAGGNINLVKYSPNKISFKVSAQGNKLLFLSDNYYPEWQGQVDGSPAKILIANYSFRAIVVPKGNHTVDFIYYPKSFRLGLMISLFTALFVLIISLCVIIKSKGLRKK